MSSLLIFLECPFSCVNLLVNLHQLKVFLCFFKPPDIEALATICALKLFLSFVVPSSFFNSHDPEKLMTDFVHPYFLYCRSPITFYNSCTLIKRSYCHIWCTWMSFLPCESSHESCGFSYFFKSSDPENLLPHLKNKTFFSPVWHSHFSFSHLILRRLCQTLIVSLL